MKELPDVLTLQEAAKFLRIHEMTLYRHAKKNNVPMVKICGQWRIRKEALLKMFEVDHGQVA